MKTTRIKLLNAPSAQSLELAILLAAKTGGVAVVNGDNVLIERRPNLKQ